MSKIKLVNESCIEQNVDVIVNAANKFLRSGGGICGAIFRKAGFKELNEACSKAKVPLKDGEVFITPAFNITSAKYIIHAVGPDFGKDPDAFNKLFDAYYNSFKLLKKYNLHSIAFPLISSGIFGGRLDNPAKKSGEQFLKAYNKFITENNDYDINVLLCAYSQKEYLEVEKYFN